MEQGGKSVLLRRAWEYFILLRHFAAGLDNAGSFLAPLLDQRRGTAPLLDQRRGTGRLLHQRVNSLVE
jgi:hypothetical protein